LKTLYGDDCALTLVRDAAAGCETCVEIPFHSVSAEAVRV